MTSHIKNISTVLLVFFFALLASNCAKDSDLFYELSQYEEEQEIVYEDETTDEQSENEEASDEVEESSEENEETSEPVEPSDYSEIFHVETPNPNFTYQSLNDAFNNASQWYDQAIIEIGGNQGGVFTFYASTSSSADGGVIIQVPSRSGKLARFWNNNGYVKAEWFGLVSNNSNVDNKEAFESMLNGKANNTERFDKIVFTGLYNFENTAYIPNINDITFLGSETTTSGFITNNLSNILQSDYLIANNLTFKNLKFESTANYNMTESQGNEASLLFFRAGFGRNHLFENCEFTAPNLYTNGAKYYAREKEAYTNIEFRNCNFYDLGRFAAELFGSRQENYNPENAAIKGITFDGGRVERTGTMGQLGISIVQTVKDVTIKNMYFKDNNASLELGANNVKVFNNEFYGNDNAIWFGGIYDDYNYPIYWQRDYEIYNNTGEVSGSLQFIAVQDIELHDNDWTFNNALKLNNAHNITFKNDNLKIMGYTNWGGGTVIPTMQFANTVHSIYLEQCNYEYLNNSTFTNNSEAITVSNSDIHIKSLSNFDLNSAKNLIDVSVYLDGVLTNILNK